MTTVGYLLSVKERPLSGKDWAGKWEIAYFYENEPGLLFQGTMYLNVEDSLSGSAEIYAPRSSRLETVAVTVFSVLEDGAAIRGEMLHTRYKISGGFMREAFELHLESPLTFSGRGRCVAFCAEGTEEAGIIWEGNKAE